MKKILVLFIIAFHFTYTYSQDTLTYGNTCIKASRNHFQVGSTIPDSTLMVTGGAHITKGLKVGSNATILGNLNCAVFKYEFPHCFYSKRDTSGFTLALPRWSWVKFTGLTEKENDSIGRITGDTIKYIAAASHLNIKVFCNATTSSANDDVWLRVVNLRSGETFYGMSLSGGNGNYSQWLIEAYDIDSQKNDKFLVQARNKSNSNALTIYSITIDLSVRHFK